MYWSAWCLLYRLRGFESVHTVCVGVLCKRRKDALIEGTFGNFHSEGKRRGEFGNLRRCRMDQFQHGRVVFTFSVCPLLHRPALLPEMLELG